MVDKPSNLPNLPGLPGYKPKVDNTLPKPEFGLGDKPEPKPVYGLGEPKVNPLTGKAVVDPRHPPEVEAAEEAFNASLTALNEVQAGRNITNIPLSDPYWGAVHTHNVAYLAYKDALREIPIASPPDSDMKHDFKVAIESINAGQPRGTAMASILTGGIEIPVENVPETFQPFQRAQIPAGVKLVAAVEQPMEEAVIVIPIPPPTEPIPEEPPVVLRTE